MASIDITYIPNIFGRTSFPLKHEGDPIFYKTFNGSSPIVVDLNRDTIFIKNHFFKTGEKLKYSLGIGNSSIGISSLSPGNVESITYLPDVVYPIVVDKDTIRVSLASSLAFSNSYVNLTSVGIGNSHFLETEKQNSKCLILIDNVVQSPISVASSVGIQTAFKNFAGKLRVESLKNIIPGTILKINDSLSKVLSVDYEQKSTPVGYGTGYDVVIDNSLSVLGIATTSIIGAEVAYIMGGNYNIVEDKIYFVDSPFEGRTFNITVPAKNLNYNSSGISSYSFNYFTSNFVTGSQVTLSCFNPPEGLISGNTYFLIKNNENNFSFSKTYLDSINNEKIEIINSSTVGNPVTDLQLIQIIPNEDSTFHGRAFLRSDYSGNVVFDDVSEDFNGISSSFTLKVSGINTVGIKSDNGIVLINNIFQYPEFEEAFVYEEDSNSGITSISFIGSRGEYSTGFGTIKDYDVNVGGLPRGGIIVGYGLSGGLNYPPMIPAELYITTVLPEEEITEENIGISVSGSGYKQNSIYNITFESPSGERVSGLATAIINEFGNVTGVIFSEFGSYTGEENISVVIDPPFGYENIPVEGSSSGIGASVSFEINKLGTVSNFKFTNVGYGYTVGEVLTPVGVITSPSSIPLTITINQVEKDKFSAWNIGILQKLNDLTPFVTGSRKSFTITETVGDQVQTLSLESITGSQINLAYNLLVFVNDVLQIPEESYTFNGGTQIVFDEAPPLGSTVKVYFYKGSINDTEFVNIDPPIEPGDLLQIRKDLLEKSPFEQQFRTVKEILTSDTLLTQLYKGTGLSNNSSQLRSISWTPKKYDKIITGEYVTKSRFSQRSIYEKFVGIGITNGTFVGINTNIIAINTSSGIGTQIQIGDYVESAYTGYGVTIVSIESSSIEIGIPGDLWVFTEVSNQITGISTQIWKNTGKLGFSTNIVGEIELDYDSNLGTVGFPEVFLEQTFPSSSVGDGVRDLKTYISSSSPSGINTVPISIWRKL
jgi:hypothetical protein